MFDLKPFASNVFYRDRFYLVAIVFNGSDKPYISITGNIYDYIIQLRYRIKKGYPFIPKKIQSIIEKTKKPEFDLKLLGFNDIKQVKDAKRIHMEGCAKNTLNRNQSYYCGSNNSSKQYKFLLGDKEFKSINDVANFEGKSNSNIYTELEYGKVKKMHVQHAVN